MGKLLNRARENAARKKILGEPLAEPKAAPVQKPGKPTTDVSLEYSIEGLGVISIPLHYIIINESTKGAISVSVENTDKTLSNPAAWNDNISEYESRLFDLGPRCGDLLVTSKGREGDKLLFSITLKGVETDLLKGMMDYWAYRLESGAEAGANLRSIAEGRPGIDPSEAGAPEMIVGFSRVGVPKMPLSAFLSEYVERGMKLVNSLGLGTDDSMMEFRAALSSLRAKLI